MCQFFPNSHCPSLSLDTTQPILPCPYSMWLQWRRVLKGLSWTGTFTTFMHLIKRKYKLCYCEYNYLFMLSVSYFAGCNEPWAHCINGNLLVYLLLSKQLTNKYNICLIGSFKTNARCKYSQINCQSYKCASSAS